MPSCFKAIYWQLQLLLHTCSANKLHQANQINRAGNTLFIIRTDLHKIIYPVSVVYFGLFNSSSSHTFPHRQAIFGGCDELARAHHESKDIPPLDQKKVIIPPPPPAYPVLLRKVKYGQYDEIVQRLIFKIEN